MRLWLTSHRHRAPHSFYVGHLLIFVYGWIKQAHDARLAGLNSLRYSVWISRGAGLCLGVDGLLIVLPGAPHLYRACIRALTQPERATPAVLRNCIRIARPLIGWAVPLDENLWCHRQFAYSLLFWTIVHTTAHCPFAFALSSPRRVR